jgi:hypothetical protein
VDPPQTPGPCRWAALAKAVCESTAFISAPSQSADHVAEERELPVAEQFRLGNIDRRGIEVGVVEVVGAARLGGQNRARARS